MSIEHTHVHVQKFAIVHQKIKTNCNFKFKSKPYPAPKLQNVAKNNLQKLPYSQTVITKLQLFDRFFSEFVSFFSIQYIMYYVFSYILPILPICFNIFFGKIYAYFVLYLIVEFPRKLFLVI